jgi:tRNA-(ms[2]io[6]A)-hydroxylase
MVLQSLPTPLQNFLKISSPSAWCEAAIENFSLLLLDHTHCERKASAFAIQLMSKYPHQERLIHALSPIAREELLHFEKMLHILKKRRIKIQPLHPCRYSKNLHLQRSKQDNKQQLIDDLIIAAIIEARSCERFFSLIPYLEKHGDQEVLRFYQHLAMAEQRHFEVYLEFANQLTDDLEQRVNIFISIENQTIMQAESMFRFHSGIPL